MNTTQKTIKWASQSTRKTKGRIEKPKPQKSTRKTVLARAANEQIEECSRKEEIKKLEKELEFAHDSMATVIVNLESIHHAYKSSESELEERRSATRLCEKEKELLTAYGEVKLQANHLERTIAKLEKQISSLKDQEETSASPYLSSPCSSIDTSLSYTTPMVNYAQPDPLLDTAYDISYIQQQLNYQTCPINNEFYGLDQSYAYNPLFGYNDYYSCDQLFYDYNNISYQMF
ncbi:unnamed protein product [Rhizopus stolonifer]